MLISCSSNSIDDPWGGKFVQEEVTGFLVGSTPKNKNEESGKGGEKGEDGDEEWKPALPEGTNMKLFGYFLGVLTEDKKKYKTDDIWGKSSHKLLSTCSDMFSLVWTFEAVRF